MRSFNLKKKKDRFHFQDSLWNRAQTLKGYRELFHRHRTYNREGETAVPFEKGLKTEKGTACTEGFSICGGLFSVREKLPNQPRPHDPTRWTSQALCQAGQNSLAKCSCAREYTTWRFGSFTGEGEGKGKYRCLGRWWWAVGKSCLISIWTGKTESEMGSRADPSGIFI